jgi:peptide/nickel transport system permease protein
LLSFIIRRLLITIVVVFLVSVIAFLLLHIIPGDPVLKMLGTKATPEAITQLRHELGLDQPIIVQYGNWIWGVVHGDMGKSLVYHENVSDLLRERLPITAYLTFLALLVSSVFGVLIGVISAVRRGSIVDNLIALFANTAVAIPTFWLGILGIYLFGLKLGWLPIEGWTSPFDDFGRSAHQLVMPIVALSVPNLAVLARQSRSAMLETIHQDYVRTATSTGLSHRIVIYKHALKNTLNPIVALIGMTLTFLIAGEVLVETVFNIPGIGRLLVRAALDKDYLIVQGGVLIIGTIVCLTNLLVDIAYGWIDPRIRYR